jgi:hypothetical protein
MPAFIGIDLGKSAAASDDPDANPPGNGGEGVCPNRLVKARGFTSDAGG